MSSTHRITVNLNEEEYIFFQALAMNMDRSLSWLGRKAICDFIEQQKLGETSFSAELSPKLLRQTDHDLSRG